MATPYIFPDVQTVETWINSPDTRPENVTVDALLVTLFDALKQTEELNRTLEENTALLEKSNTEIMRLCDEMSKEKEGKLSVYAKYQALPEQDRKEVCKAIIFSMGDEIRAQYAQHLEKAQETGPLC